MNLKKEKFGDKAIWILTIDPHIPLMNQVSSYINPWAIGGCPRVLREDVVVWHFNGAIPKDVISEALKNLGLINLKLE